ncbi:MAG: hypothetical protein ACK4P4_00490 [Allorhizobium sp.]
MTPTTRQSHWLVFVTTITDTNQVKTSAAAQIDPAPDDQTPDTQHGLSGNPGPIVAQSDLALR